MKHLYIIGGDTCQSLRELIKFGFNGHRHGFFKETFFDEACTLEEDINRRRSFEDLLCVAQTYFPATTEKDLALCLADLGANWRVRGLYCSNIDKIVFVADSSDSYYNKLTIRSLDDDHKGRSPYSKADIFALADLDL